METFEERGKRFARKHKLMLGCVDDALAGLDCDFLQVTRERLKLLWDTLQEIQSDFLHAPQSDYVRDKQDSKLSQ